VRTDLCGHETRQSYFLMLFPPSNRSHDATATHLHVCAPRLCAFTPRDAHPNAAKGPCQAPKVPLIFSSTLVSAKPLIAQTRC
jgi:hypothetical protein